MGDISATYGRPLIANIANSTPFTGCFLLACQLRTPSGVTYGAFCGTPEDHQTGHPYKSNRPKTHKITYNNRLLKARRAGEAKR
jgi:hypothetical protein